MEQSLGTALAACCRRRAPARSQAPGLAGQGCSAMEHFLRVAVAPVAWFCPLEGAVCVEGAQVSG